MTDLFAVRLSALGALVEGKGLHIKPDPDLLQRLGIDPTRPIVVYVGRITRQKGLPHLLEAAGRLDALLSREEATA